MGLVWLRFTHACLQSKIKVVLHASRHEGLAVEACLLEGLALENRKKRQTAYIVLLKKQHKYVEVSIWVKIFEV